MKFKTEDLDELVFVGAVEGMEIIKDVITEKLRWEVLHRVIFSFGNRFFVTTYSVGATEYQEKEPFEGEGDEIECKEVFQKERTIVVYE